MTDLSGATIAGRYKISKQIASGGMATVYLAVDTRLDRKVALKIVHRHLANESSFREKFIQEAKISARLSHPNLVNVFDQGEDGENLFLAMEYVEGTTLRDALKRLGPLSPKRALELYESLLAGLAAAHKAGILHRDLKPENVLLADDGRIKLADFGLARNSTAQTQAEDLFGTVAYLSPELIQRGNADARSDVYAAGVMLFELVTGQQPFKGEEAMQIAYQHANDMVPAPSSIDPEIPEVIDDLVQWATERNQAERPADAGEFLKAIKQARQQLSGTAKQTRSNATTRLSTAELETELDNAATQLLGGIDSDATQLIDGQISAATQVLGTTENFDQTQVLGAVKQTSSDSTAISRRHSRLSPLKFTIVTLLVLLLGLGTGWAFGSGPFAPFQIPALTGLSESQARAALSPCNCKVTSEFVYSTAVAKGRVVSSNPPAGTVSWGDISIQVSKGARLVAAPKLMGMNVAEATAEVLKSGFKLGKVSSWFNQAPIGTIYEYQGSDGQKIAENSTIDLKISLGSLPILSNIDQALATTALEAAGLKVAKVTNAPSDTVAIGKVINFVPLTDPIGAGGEVELIVSSGPAN